MHSSASPVAGTFSKYLFNVSFICFNSLQYSEPAAAETPISAISAILVVHDNLFSRLLPAPRSALRRELALSRVQGNWKRCNLQEQILMEKYHVIEFSGGGTDIRIPDFTFSALKLEVQCTIQ